MGSGAYDQDFAYSAIHTITSFDGASYTYGTGNDPGAGDAGPHAVVSISSGAITFGYDDNGNRITRTESSQTTSYSYGDDNRLEQVTLPDTSTVEFVYDADGNRVSRANGDDSTRYVAGLMEVDYDQTTVTETRTFYSFAGTSVAVRAHTEGTVAYSFGNHLGSPVAAFEDTTNTLSRMGYEPYGTERAVTGALPSDHRFTNQIADNTTHPSGGTGLLFYNARYYDPEVGAFVAADTLIPDPTLPVDMNRYAYVGGNPVNATDPSGHETCGYRGGVYYCWSELEMIDVGAVDPDGPAGPEFADVASVETPPKPGLANQPNPPKSPSARELAMHAQREALRSAATKGYMTERNRERVLRPFYLELCVARTVLGGCVGFGFAGGAEDPMVLGVGLTAGAPEVGLSVTRPPGQLEEGGTALTVSVGGCTGKACGGASATISRSRPSFPDLSCSGSGGITTACMGQPPRYTVSSDLGPSSSGGGTPSVGVTLRLLWTVG